MGKNLSELIFTMNFILSYKFRTKLFLSKNLSSFSTFISNKKYSFKNTKVNCLSYLFGVSRMPRNSCSKLFCKEIVLKTFSKFTGKHLCRSLFFNKVVGPATILKKRLRHWCFPANFTKFLRTPFYIEHLW